MNIPILITLFRIAAIPFMVLVYYLPIRHAPFFAALIFLCAAVSDWLDGYLARNLLQSSRFGAFLDPVADKLLVAVALVLIVSKNSFAGLPIPAAIIVGREIVVSALREWMAEIGSRRSVAVSWIGKIKTGFQMVAVGFLLWYNPGLPFWVLWVSTVLLYIAAGLTLWSMCQYLKIAWPDLTSASK